MFRRSIKTFSDVVDWGLCVGCGACAHAKPGVLHTVATGTSGHLGLYRLEMQVTAGNGKLTTSGLGSNSAAKEAAKVANYEAIVPSVKGWARITGYNTIFIDDRDPFAHGFVVQ